MADQGETPPLSGFRVSPGGTSRQGLASTGESLQRRYGAQQNGEGEEETSCWWPCSHFRMPKRSMITSGHRAKVIYFYDSIFEAESSKERINDRYVIFFNTIDRYN
uniref:Uncharacterized protein n=1 Tax=Sphaerodactylus townsendi TaxID=933632 RepID=A0ACB8ENL9_9SAUR